MRGAFRGLVRGALAWDRGRTSRLTRMLDQLGTELRSVCRNEDHRIARNGEAWLMGRIGALHPRAVLFDVGANRGEWAGWARRKAPESHVHCFELCPATFQHLQTHPALASGATLNPFGLGATSGPVTFNYVPQTDSLTSLHPVICADPARVQQVRGTLQRGDDYARRHGIAQIHLLKCDVEGGEPEVLEGFSTLLRAGRIAAIQFEYGRVNLARRFLLSDFYALLQPYGYRIGKLYPGRIAWKSYELADEDFVGPNYVAMQPAMIEACRLADRARGPVPAAS